MNTEKTSPQNGRNEEIKKHKDFKSCDSFNATYCNGSGLIVVPEDKKHVKWVVGDSCLNELFGRGSILKKVILKNLLSTLYN